MHALCSCCHITTSSCTTSTHNKDCHIYSQLNITHTIITSRHTTTQHTLTHYTHTHHTHIIISSQHSSNRTHTPLYTSHTMHHYHTYTSHISRNRNRPDRLKPSTQRSGSTGATLCLPGRGPQGGIKDQDSSRARKPATQRGGSSATMQGLRDLWGGSTDKEIKMTTATIAKPVAQPSDSMNEDKEGTCSYKKPTAQRGGSMTAGSDKIFLPLLSHTSHTSYHTPPPAPPTAAITWVLLTHPRSRCSSQV